MKKLFTSAIILLFVVVLDQLSKWYVAEFFSAAGGSIALLGFCNIVQVWNPGISFGMFSKIQNGNVAFMGVSIVIVSVLVFILLREKSLARIMCLSLIIGGALGNFIDRAREGAVYDFIDLHIAGWHWPAFNVADASILCGVSVFLFLELRSGKGDAARSSA